MPQIEMIEQKQPVTLCAVLHVSLKGPSQLSSRTLKACLEEAVGLANAIDLKVCHQQIIQLNRVSAATLIGAGNVEVLAGIVKGLNINLVVIDTTLSPIQQRNLERAWKCKVIDRTGLILEIFGQRARTAEGALQVELAALKHQRSRLVRSWTHLERQRGGFGFTGGPGEKQIELDRRLIDQRLLRLEKDLEKTKRTRGLHRKARQKNLTPTIALVGYTNAGKSTLFNRLTQSTVLAEDLLFATLDPTMRTCKLPNGQRVIFSDTVGFISNLPTQLIAAFRATLEEVCLADIILHVQDYAHPDAAIQANDVMQVLEELQIELHQEKPIQIQVFNKMDLLEDEKKRYLNNMIERLPHGVALSAQTGDGVEALLNLLCKVLRQEGKIYQLTCPATRGDLLSWCYQEGVLVSRYDKDDQLHLTLQLTPAVYSRLLSKDLLGCQLSDEEMH